MNELVEQKSNKQSIMAMLIYTYLGIYALNINNVSIILPFILLPLIFLNDLNNSHTLRYYLNGGTLLLFCITFIIISQLHFLEYSTINAFFIILAPISMFALGYSSAKKLNTDQVLKSMIVTVSFLTIFGFLSYINTVWTFGTIEQSRIFFEGKRYLLNIWSNNVLAATGINTFFSLSLSLFPVIFYQYRDEKKYLIYRIILLVNFIASVYVITQLGNRTGFVLIFLSLILVIFFNSKSLKNTMKIFIILLLSIFIYTIMYNYNIFNLHTYINSSLIFSRFRDTGLESGRSEAWITVLTNAIKYPIGGREINIRLNYAHNLWLDVVYDVGWLPFILIILFTFSVLKNILVFLSNKEHSHFIKNAIICIFSSFFLTFFIEPIMQGWVLYFSVFCFFSGLILSLNDSVYIKNRGHNIGD